MADLIFGCTGATAERYAVTPTLAFQLTVTERSGVRIHAIALRCQIQIEVTRRQYASQEQERLLDLFGTPDRWSQTLRTLLWTHVQMVVPGFEGPGNVVDMQVPCTADFNVAATKYFDALESGEIPLQFLFSGTSFYSRDDGQLQVAPISWEQEARFRLSATTWREMIDSYYPNSVFINLRRDVFDQLNQYKMQHGIPTWEQALERMLAAEEAVRS